MPVATPAECACPTYTLTRQELRALVEFAIKAPSTLADGYVLHPLLTKVQAIINSQYDLVTDIPYVVETEPEKDL